MSGKAFASAIGISPNFLSTVEHGKSKPSVDMLVGIACVFPDIDARWLLTGETDRPGSSQVTVTGEMGRDLLDVAEATQREVSEELGLGKLALWRKVSAQQARWAMMQGLFSVYPGGLTLAEMHADMRRSIKEISLSTVAGILYVELEAGTIREDQEGRYKLGAGWLELNTKTSADVGFHTLQAIAELSNHILPNYLKGVKRSIIVNSKAIASKGAGEAFIDGLLRYIRATWPAETDDREAEVLTVVLGTTVDSKK